MVVCGALCEALVWWFVVPCVRLLCGALCEALVWCLV